MRGNLADAQHDMGQPITGKPSAGMGLREGRQICADVSTCDARNRVDRGDTQHLDRLVVYELNFKNAEYQGGGNGWI